MADAELRELARLGAALVACLGTPSSPPPSLTLTASGAAERLGVSPGFFRAEVLPELRVIRRGARVLVPVSELERWIERNAARTCDR
ncbi:MAG: hypothetical protein U0R52_06155 [Solirubrobacterales bacterium]